MQTFRDLVIRNGVDQASGVDYGLDESEQDLSDHFPLVATLTTAGTTPHDSSTGASSGSLVAAFWNVENLFDTVDDPATAGDEEYTPGSPKRWTDERLTTKLTNLAMVIKAMNDERGPDVLGLCEVENKAVVDKLVAGLTGLGRSYEVVHKDSPSDRGIDCALVYDKNVFELVGQEFHFVDADNTRDIVEAKLKKQDKTLHVFINHWPSRNNSASQRKKAALVLRGRIDALLTADPNADILIMGDLNDHPNDAAVQQHLRATGDSSDLSDGELFNAMWAVHEDPEPGTYVFDGAWEVIDHVIVSKGMLDSTGFRLQTGSAAPVLLLDEQLFDPSGPAIARPNRSYSGDNFHPDGFSDHLPVSCRILF